MQISVVLCTYNGEKYLDEQINSIKNQTLLPFELIVSDDCSSDKTLNILEQHQNNSFFPFFIYKNEKRLGVAKNFEQAILKAKGDIIVLSDQDDIWKKDKLENIYKLFSNNVDIGFAFSNALLINSSGDFYKSTLWDKVKFNDNDRNYFSTNTTYQLKILLKKNIVTGATLAFKGNLKNIICPIPPMWVHDEWISLIITLHGYKGIAIEKPLIYYRIHPKQQIGVRFNNTLKKKIKFLLSKVHRVEFELNKWLQIENLVNRPYQFDSSTINLLSQKIDFVKFRIHLRNLNRLHRILKIFRKNYLVHYSHYADGIRSILWDIAFPKYKNKL